MPLATDVLLSCFQVKLVPRAKVRNVFTSAEIVTFELKSDLTVIVHAWLFVYVFVAMY